VSLQKFKILLGQTLLALDTTHFYFVFVFCSIKNDFRFRH
jgi:hypothetical protein